MNALTTYNKPLLQPPKFFWPTLNSTYGSESLPSPIIYKWAIIFTPKNSRVCMNTCTLIKLCKFLAAHIAVRERSLSMFYFGDQNLWMLFMLVLCRMKAVQEQLYGPCLIWSQTLEKFTREDGGQVLGVIRLDLKSKFWKIYSRRWGTSPCGYQGHMGEKRSDSENTYPTASNYEINADVEWYSRSDRWETKWLREHRPTRLLRLCNADVEWPTRLLSAE